jgi:integrase
VVARRNARGGRSAAEHLIAALRCIYRHAENDGHIQAGDNPALKVAKPRRLPSTRRAVPDTRLAEINRIAATTGNDPALDALILRLHTETACRRGGALALTPADLDVDQCLIRLTEKGEKTLITHIEDGLDFLGWRIQRHRKRGTTSKHFVYVYPAKKSLTAITAKVKTTCWQDVNLPLDALLRQLNQALRGWTAYFKHGVSKATFNYLRAHTWKQVFGWLRRKRRRANWKELRRRFTCDGWWPATGTMTLFNPAGVKISYYSYRGTKIPAPWPSTT